MGNAVGSIGKVDVYLQVGGLGLTGLVAVGVGIWGLAQKEDKSPHAELAGSTPWTAVGIASMLIGVLFIIVAAVMWRYRNNSTFDEFMGAGAIASAVPGASNQFVDVAALGGAFL